METIKHFFYVINFRTIMIGLISASATFLCGYFSLTCDMPASLIGIAVVFPLVFSINASFQRRDLALNEYGELNARLVSLYFAHKLHLSQNAEDNTSREFRDRTLKFLKLVEDDLTDEKNSKSRKEEIYNYSKNIK